MRGIHSSNVSPSHTQRQREKEKVWGERKYGYRLSVGKSSMTRSFLLRSAPVGAVGRRRLESAREKSMFPFLFFLGSF